MERHATIAAAVARSRRRARLLVPSVRPLDWRGAAIAIVLAAL